jgi:putative flippase GtrA
MGKIRKPGKDWFYPLLRFSVTGVLAAGIDYGVYILLFHPAGIVLAKSVSFITATVFTFLMNKFWTFEKKGWDLKEVLKYVAFYAVSMVLNTLINKIIFDLTGQKVPAFIAATGFCAVFNFIGLRLVVFKK